MKKKKSVPREIARLIRGILPGPATRFILKARKILNREGNLPSPYTSAPNVESTLKTLAKAGFKPALAIDVGAYHGEWTLTFNEIFPNAAVLMIEAQQSKTQKLNEICHFLKPLVALETALLSESDGLEVTFSEMETGSSVYTENSPYPRRLTRLKTRTLDAILEERHMSANFLKIDVQGYELAVLKGASRALKEIEVVLVEASLIPVNTGCPLITEVITWMDSNGFRLSDFCSQIRRKDGFLWQTDLLFIKNSSDLLPQPKLTEDNWG